MAEELAPKEELRATLAAQRELGRDFDEELVERFGQQLERWLQAREPARLKSDQRTGIAIVSLLASIPLIAIAGDMAGLVGVLAVCAAIVLVNYVVNR